MKYFAMSLFSSKNMFSILGAILLLASLISVLVVKQDTVLADNTKSQTREIKIKEKTFPIDAIQVVKMHNDQSDTFPTDFKIEIKNISNKPIHFISFHLTFFGSAKALNSPRDFGLVVFFGNTKLLDIEERGEPNDVTIKPGETGFLTVSENSARATYNAFQQEKVHKEATAKIRLYPQVINFGDGTGYQLNIPYDLNKKVSSSFEKAKGLSKSQTSVLFSEQQAIHKSFFSINRKNDFVSNLFAKVTFQSGCGGTISGGDCAKWKLQFNRYGCGIEGCGVQTNFGNVGTSCTKVTWQPAYCVDETGIQQTCASYWLDPCDTLGGNEF